MNMNVQRHLGTRLFLSYLAIIMVVVVVLIFSSQFILPAAFNRHMGMMYSGSMGTGMMGQNDYSMSRLFVDFRDSFNEALMYAALAAMITAIMLSSFLSRRVTAPVQIMSLATQRIAEGRYDERVQVKGEDELAQLATRFNQMAEKLEQVESMRRRLIGDVSHELRTPLTAIKGSMEGLMDGLLPANDETYRQIHAEADRLNRLVDDLQELSRVEARTYRLNRQPVDILVLVSTVTKRLGAKAQAKHIFLELELEPLLPRILADEDQLMQILTNLIGNALQYTPAGGNITILVKRVDGEILFSVRDTGIGIPAEHLAPIFDRFYRVDKSRSRAGGGGSGIGLTIARALIEAHGGRIWAESAGEGAGSTFSFALPIQE